MAPYFPPEVKTFVPTVYSTNPYEAVYQNGMFRHETYTAWTMMMRRRGMDVADATVLPRSHGTERSGIR